MVIIGPPLHIKSPFIKLNKPKGKESLSQNPRNEEERESIIKTRKKIIIVEILRCRSSMPVIHIKSAMGMAKDRKQKIMHCSQ